MTSIPLDIRTLSLITVLFAFIIGIGLITFSMMQHSFRGLAWAGIGIVVTGCGFLLIGLRDYTSAFFSIVIANTLIVAGFAFIYKCICIINDLQFKKLFFLIAISVQFAGEMYYTYYNPSLANRMFILSVNLAVISSYCCWCIISHKLLDTRTPHIVTALGFFLFTLFLIFYALWALNKTSSQNFMNAGTIHGFGFLAIIFLFIIISFGLFWIVNDSLQQHLEQYERIISSTPDMIVLADADGKYKMANDAFLKTLNMTHENILDKNSAELFGKEFHDTVTLPNLQKALKGEVATVFRWFESPVLGRRYVVLYYHPVPDADGTISLVAISARDMTDLHMAQEDRQRIFNLSLDMLSIASMDGCFREINPAFERILGWNKEALIKRPWNDFVHPDDLEKNNEMTQALVKGEPVMDFVNRMKTKDGSYRFISWTSHPDMVNQLIYSAGRDVTERIKMEAILKEQATTDPLTGAGNRRLFMQRANEEIERAIRYNTPLSLIIIDIDHFKAINDTHGHEAGDEVLKALVVAMRKQLRISDVFCRIGGEEFAALLINADQDSAAAFSERIRKTLADLEVTTDTAAVTFTVSVGVTCHSGAGDSLRDMLKRADSALYAAKSAGRNAIRAA